MLGTAIEAQVADYIAARAQLSNNTQDRLKPYRHGHPEQRGNAFPLAVRVGESPQPALNILEVQETRKN